VARVVLSLVAFAALAGSACAQASYGMAPKPGDKEPDFQGDASFKPELGKGIPAGLTFYDHDKNPVMIQELMGGKPTILVLAYYRCPKLCNEVLLELLQAMKSASLAGNGYFAGDQFNVVVVSIDPREAPEQGRIRRDLFLREYDGRSSDKPGVWFLTASRGQGTVVTEAEANVKALADAVGFHYVYDKTIKQYIHDSGILVLAADGTMTQFFPGITYSGKDIRFALVEAGKGKVGSYAMQGMTLCFAYDQTTGKYKPTMRALAIVAVPFALLVVGLAVYTGRKVYRERAPRFGPVPPTTEGV
jgi:protein SCO1/2